MFSEVMWSMGKMKCVCGLSVSVPVMVVKYCCFKVNSINMTRVSSQFIVIMEYHQCSFHLMQPIISPLCSYLWLAAGLKNVLRW